MLLIRESFASLKWVSPEFTLALYRLIYLSEPSARIFLAEQEET